MAVVRGGKRLGPFDIRGGISRGDFKNSAYHKTDKDPRFKQRSIKESTVGRFRSAMNSAEGYARPNKFAIRIFPPVGLEQTLANANNSSLREGSAYNAELEDEFAIDAANEIRIANQLYGRQVNINCDSIIMPGVDLQTQAVQFGSEPTRNMVTGHGFDGNIVATFYVDKYLREKQFFELWQKLAVNTISHKANYYDNYIGKMQIYQLGSDNESGGRDKPTYAIEAREVYPEKIGEMDYNYGANNQIGKVTINFGYKQWFNMGIEDAGGLTFGKSMQTTANVKSENQGLFGLLPPSIQRAGRNVIQQGRTVFNPTGRIFKGKVFGPFF
tara:strand:- start:48 stop:1031 length:984 start_codon:yes stop_codon:yes gene_type:complete